MNGSSIAGGNPERGRVEDDYYATNPQDTQAFMDLIKSEYNLEGKSALEPAAGGGHISEVLKQNGMKVTSRDLVNRGYYDSESGIDFLSDKEKENFDFVITNPPFSIAKQFIDKSLEVSDLVFIFAKLQFLEGKARKKWFSSIPLKYVYVYSYRANPWRNGESVDENGKKWSSTMAFAWYVFDKSYVGEPTLRWI